MTAVTSFQQKQVKKGSSKTIPAFTVADVESVAPACQRKNAEGIKIPLVCKALSAWRFPPVPSLFFYSYKHTTLLYSLRLGRSHKLSSTLGHKPRFNHQFVYKKMI